MILNETQIAPALRQRISAEQAFHYRIVPIDHTDKGLLCKTDNTALESLMSELEIVLDTPVLLEPCAEEELQKLLTANYRQQDTLRKDDLHYSTDFLEQLLTNAKGMGSSDIHFEPYEKRCRVRFRLDGKLIEQHSIALEEYPTIVNKIKIKADLDISEKRLPQDGRITLQAGTDEFDIRVSSLPTLHGEKLVLRILSKDATLIDLDGLGFSEDELVLYREGLRRPSGIILISGPTGSGKTTTLYATLKELNTAEENILTLEDPIEYTLEGINQVQLKESIGLDFARTLKTFLRQDPNIIMIGEIRDVDTANIAIRAAQTGHLVLSTIHTNSAWGTISRLIDMGVPSFLIASTLNSSIAQRLVRKLCPHCKRENVLEPGELPLGLNLPRTLKTHFKAVGCNACHHTGYSGRKAIYEILPMTKALMGAIKNNQLHIDDYIKERGIRTLRTNALHLVATGVTSIEEVYPLLSDTL